MSDDPQKLDLDADTGTEAPDSDQVSINELDTGDSGHKDTQNIPPAVHDSGAASGHAPDLEADDDVDDLGDEAGINYDVDEELGIDQKVNVATETTPPEEDRPY